jgi:transcriptional regulator with XRE-family HTH domain
VPVFRLRPRAVPFDAYYNCCNNLSVSGQELRAAREALQLTQVAAARRWRVSQAYLSLMEQGRRPVPERVARLAVRASPNLATGLALDPARVKETDVERQLGNLGYPGFAYLQTSRQVDNPAAVVLGALRASAVPARVTEALPWVMVTYPQLDWNWLVDHARLANRQNRLGFLVTLARQLAARRGDDVVRSVLEQVEHRLGDARLVKEDTLGRSLTEVERAHLRSSRPEAAAYWNVLTSLQVDQLRYAT